MNDQYIPEGKDPQRWRIAKRRASFKRHLAVYIVVNLFLWLVWFFTGSRNDEAGIACLGQRRLGHWTCI